MQRSMLTLTILAIAATTVSAQTISPPKAEPTNANEAAAQQARAAADLDDKYQAWVATLTPARQAWEKILQAELGGFYLPIHKREKVAGKSNAWDFVEDDPGLPRVLLIGDSVSRAYTQTVRTELTGKANVHRAPANCGPTATGVKRIDVWLRECKWDVIHFNFGIHDRATPIADYTGRLEQLVERMKQSGARLVWASTTPIPDVPEKKYSAVSIVERNAAAAEVMKKHGVLIDDLFAAIAPRLAELQNPNDVHFNGPGNVFLGQQVAMFLENVLDDRSRSSGGSPEAGRDEGTSLGNIRLEAATGEDRSPLVNIPKPDGMVQRSLQFVKWLSKENPAGNWDQFLTDDQSDLRWEKVIMAGISHGSTTAARFAKHQQVARVVMFSGPRIRSPFSSKIATRFFVPGCV